MQYENLENEIKMGMNLIERNEFTATIRAISHIAAQTVGRTLGPYAHTTIIDDGDFTYPTKDGWSVLQRLRFQDPTHNSIFAMLKNISGRIVDKVGDGTTTAMVTADHFIDYISKAMSSDLFKGARQADVVDAIYKVRDEVIKRLHETAVPITPSPDQLANHDTSWTDAIYNIAYISSNGNKQLADIMKQIYAETGNPNISVDMAGGDTISYEIQKGYRLDCKFLMAERYINTSEKTYSSMGNPHFCCIFNHTLTYQKHAEMINALIRYADQQMKPLILIAPYFDDVLTSNITVLIQQELQQHPKSIPGLMLVQVPELTRKVQRDALNDFAAISNNFLITDTKVKIFHQLRHNEKAPDDEQITIKETDVEEFNFTTAQALIESCGAFISDFTIGPNFFLLENINKESVIYKETLQKAQQEYDEAKAIAQKSTTSLMKDYMDAAQRLNKLQGLMGIIHVGGITDLEKQCTMDTVDDTFRACRSAFEHGIVPGLNMGPLTVMYRMTAEYEKDDDAKVTLEQLALNAMYSSYFETTKDILRNKYPDDEATNWHYLQNTSNGWVLLNSIISDIADGNILCYDIVSEKACVGNQSALRDSSNVIVTDGLMTVCNSVDTDVEILYGITSILSMVLTSDQYMSVSRMYDRVAAIRQQEALNARTNKATIESYLDAADNYLVQHPSLPIAKLIQSYDGPNTRNSQ